MKIAKEKVDLKKTLIAILTMLLGVVCVDLYLVVIRFIGNDYSVFKLAVFRNFFAVIPLLVLLFFSGEYNSCLLYTSPSPRDKTVSRMPSSA